jgi:hypothetical protein
MTPEKHTNKTMKKLSITKAGFTAFTNPMHTEVHTKILAYIDNYGITSLGLDKKTVEEYRASIAKQQEYINHSYASALTPQIASARTLRNNWYTYIRKTIEASEYSPVTSRQTAYNTLQSKLLSVYPSISGMTDGQSATAQIRGFVQEAQNEYKAQIELFSLTDAVSTLADCNEDFAKKYALRNTERAELVPSEMAKTRVATDALYRTLSYIIQGNALSEPEDEALQKVAEKCGVAVGEIGVLLGDWQYRLRISRKGAVVAPDAGSDEDAAGDTGNTVGNEDDAENADDNHDADAVA